MKIVPIVSSILFLLLIYLNGILHLVCNAAPTADGKILIDDFR